MEFLTSPPNFTGFSYPSLSELLMVTSVTQNALKTRYMCNQQARLHLRERANVGDPGNA